MPDFWTMNVHECPHCGSHLRYGGDPHECGPRDDSHIRYNLATTDEEKAALSEAVRLLHRIDEAFWYRNRPEVLPSCSASVAMVIDIPMAFPGLLKLARLRNV